MKKIILLLITFLIFGACSQFDDKEKVEEIKIEVDRIELNKTDGTLGLKINETAQLSATVFYSNGVEGHRGIEWTSSNEEYVTVEDGVVTAVKEGGTSLVKASRGGVESSIQVDVEEIVYYVVGALSDDIDWDYSNENNIMLSDENGILYKEIVIDDIADGSSELRKFKFTKDGTDYKPLFEGEDDFLNGLVKVEGTIEESLSTCKIYYVNGTYRISLDARNSENITWSIEKIN